MTLRDAREAEAQRRWREQAGSELRGSSTRGP